MVSPPHKFNNYFKKYLLLFRLKNDIIELKKITMKGILKLNKKNNVKEIHVAAISGPNYE